jgi:hypothetical protein
MGQKALKDFKKCKKILGQVPGSGFRGLDVQN